MISVLIALVGIMAVNVTVMLEDISVLCLLVLTVISFLVVILVGL